MPFDGTNYLPRIATREEFHSASRLEKLRMLSTALRQIDRSHAWLFENIGIIRTEKIPADCKSFGCALGWGRAIWGFFSSTDLTGRDPTARSIFGLGRPHRAYEGIMEIQPHHVADEIDRYLAEKNHA
jgi:hypothetical protein